MQLLADQGGRPEIVGWILVAVGSGGVVIHLACAPFVRLTALGGAVSLWATRVAAIVVAWEVVDTLPLTANHVFLELLCLAYFALFDDRHEREGAVLLQCMRAMTAVFFFYTGLQKLLYGYYFQGEFLAYLAGTEERFSAFFKYFMSGEDLQRLQSYNEKRYSTMQWAPRIGAGPYRVDSWSFVAVSNSVYIFEMAAGVLLAWRKARGPTVLAAIVFVILIELGARELTFGALMISLLLLFCSRPWMKWCWPVLAVGYALLLIDALDGHKWIWYSPA